MPEPPRNAFQYSIIRVLPRVERGESLNVGVVLLCRPARFLGARIALDEKRLAAFADAGVTDVSVRVVPIGQGRDELLASSRRTREYLATLNGVL